ncbi:MAG: hypothetical protein H6867_05550 [Rhodospirillales bacterium]|nr:hypothetical protein [Rhodospirillales bacterium]MCB9994995.1 hypothetical protein [Rhodospirillales bacterium]
MGELIPKIIKWNIQVIFSILGLYFFILVKEIGHIGPMILGIFCFGIVYWMHKTSQELAWQIAVTTVGILIVSGTLANYGILDWGLYGAGFYTSWIAWTVTIGSPAIGYAYKKFS